MDHYLVNTMPLGDEDWVFVEDPPLGTEILTHRMATGQPMGSDFPDDARIYMDRRHRGVALPDLVGNTMAFLIVSRRLQERLAAEVAAPVEYLRVALYNHKKRLASDDYFIVNPLGSFDCLDLGRSKIERLGTEIVDVDEYVLDPHKMSKAPDFFRILETPRTYVMSKRLLATLRPAAPTNFFVHPLKA